MEKKQANQISSPEGFLRQLLLVAKICDIRIPLEGENSTSNLDDTSLEQVVKMSNFHTMV